MLAQACSVKEKNVGRDSGALTQSRPRRALLHSWLRRHPHQRPRPPHPRLPVQAPRALVRVHAARHSCARLQSRAQRRPWRRETCPCRERGSALRALRRRARPARRRALGPRGAGGGTGMTAMRSGLGGAGSARCAGSRARTLCGIGRRGRIACGSCVLFAGSAVRLLVWLGLAGGRAVISS